MPTFSYYRDWSDEQVVVDIAEDEVFAGYPGPTQMIIINYATDDTPLANATREAVQAGATIAAAPASPAPVAPDSPSLSDWRVGLTLWGRIDDVTSRVATLCNSATASDVITGKIARERLEYGNTVLRANLLSLKDVMGFTADEVEESLWRAARVALGDLSGVWPLAANAAANASVASSTDSPAS